MLMEKELILKRLNCLIDIYTDGADFQADKDLMAKPISLLPYEMASLFLDIEKEFAVDLDKLVPDLITFLPNEITDKLAIM